MSIISRTAPLTRLPVGDYQAISMGVDASLCAQQVRALTGVGDLDTVRNAMIDRFARVIVNEKDDATSAQSTKMYRANSRLKLDYATKEAILAGQQEIVRFYLFNNITRARATLFSEASQRYEYTDTSTADTIGEVREEGGANLAAQRWDVLADGCGSSVMYIADAGGVLSYTEIPPHQIWIGHAETIIDGDTERNANTLSLDEASIVAIELASNRTERKFVAWFGPCQTWPDGRNVVYYAQNWYDVPGVGTAGAFEYSASARGYVAGATDCANPLSLIAKSQGDKGAPVYPITIAYSDAMRSGLLPTSTSLFQICGELDLMGSMVIGAAGRGARGTDILKRGDSSSPVPDQTGEGLVLVGRNDEFTKTGWPASHSKDAIAVINEFSRHIAESYAVPGWLVVADAAGEVPSGVALEIMTLPLTRCRRARIEANRASVARRFAIERLIINGAVGKTVIPQDEKETWHAGEQKWPTDPMVSLMTWEKRITMGEADLGDVVQEMRGLQTHEEALNWLDERGEIRKNSPALAQKSAPKVSLAERLKAAKAAKEQKEGNDVEGESTERKGVVPK